MQINVGFLMSYDYIYLKDSLHLVYDQSDKIVLALDENLTTWSGNKFTIEENFFLWLKDFDTKGKIEIYRDNFYDPNLTSIQNDTLERIKLSDYFGKGNWYIQLDSDELFINFKGYVAVLKKNAKFLINPEKNQVQIFLFIINLFKKVEGGYLYVSKPFEPFAASTNFANYKKCRLTHSRKIYFPFFIVHNTWARANEEIYFKLNNWGHNKDFDVEKYYVFWKNFTKENYQNFKNVHPLEGKKWKELDFCPGENLRDVVDFFETSDKLQISSVFLCGKNIAQKFKHWKF
jgi:hypothetical protein